VGKTPSAQAENIRVNSCNSWANPHQRKLKYSWKFVKFVGKTPSAQAENIRANSCNSWANPSAQAENICAYS